MGAISLGVYKTKVGVLRKGIYCLQEYFREINGATLTRDFLQNWAKPHNEIKSSGCN